MLVARAAADVAFSHVDSAACGRLTRAEFCELYRQFLVAEDPDTPAGWFWGPIEEPIPIAGPRRLRRVPPG